MIDEERELKPVDICLGNFIESMGHVEMVTGIVQAKDNTFKIGHTGWGEGKSIVPDGVMYATYAIILDDKWKKCFGIDEYKLPDWIKYVHEVQNYFKWSLKMDLREIMNWDLLPKQV
jgi:hypothetical protein